MAESTRKAMYAFSGDPITYGHIDIVERASRAFDQVVVGIGVNPDKRYTFTLEERAEMACRSLAGLPNVDVVSFQGLLVDYAYENGIRVIVRGVRNGADLDYEHVLHHVNASQKLGIDTHLLFARAELAHVSSSAVRALQKEQGLIHEYVPLYVKQCLEARISGQYIVGVTGEIGAGKSYVGRRFSELGKERGIEVHDVELDHIGHRILGELKEPRYQEVRQRIVDAFGGRVGLPDGSIDRKALGEIVFGDLEALRTLNEIMYTPLLVRLRRALYGKRGLILLNAALIAESNLSHLCNGNVVLVYADTSTQEARLAQRNLTPEQIRRRLGSQYTFEGKRTRLAEAIEKHRQGKVWTIDNSDSSNAAEEINRTFSEVVEELGVT